MAAAAALAPRSQGDAAEALREADASGRTVRFVGGGTKLGWGRPGAADVELSTAGLDRVVEHNAADLTAVVEAGAPFDALQEAFAAAGQMIALDPPSVGATIGGVVAAGDSGPLRHRYGAPRDLLLGIRVALADGTVAAAGGRVIKNVAGYDLAKLFAGSFGTLGLILQVAVRLHPLPPRRVTVVGRADDPAALCRAAIAVGGAPLELEALDVRWRADGGALLARAAGVAPEDRAGRIADTMRAAGLETSVPEAADDAWRAQRDGQRGEGRVVVRVSSVRSDLDRVLRAARAAGADLVGRAGVGLSWLRLPEAAAADASAMVGELRRALAPRPVAVLDAPAAVLAATEPWPEPAGPDLMRRVKDRFDPRGTCNPGLAPGGR
jgi:glycolate oxidase FAD binding subunit